MQRGRVFTVAQNACPVTLGLRDQRGDESFWRFFVEPFAVAVFTHAAWQGQAAGRARDGGAERLSALKAKRAGLQSQIGAASATEPVQRHRLTEAKVSKLSSTIRSALHTAPPAMRKAYFKLFVDNVIISKEEIRMSGPKGVLAKAALNELPNTPGEVITFVREWRPVGDSNPCYRRERGTTAILGCSKMILEH